MNKYFARFSCMAMMVGTFMLCSTGFADVGPTCGGGGYYHCIEPFQCDITEYCTISEYTDGDHFATGMGMNTSFTTGVMNYYIVDRGQSVREYCKNYCRISEAACETDECREQYQPVNIDCSQIEDIDDRKECEYRCNDEILSSKCGMNCILNGVADDDAYRGCVFAANQEYEDCLRAHSDDDDCATLPLRQTNHWSLLSILLTFLMVVTSGLIIFVNHKREN